MSDIPKYVFLDEPDTEEAVTRIMISEGKFDGFVYRYGTIKIEEDKETGDGKLSYDYELMEAPAVYEVEDEEEEKDLFEKVIGDILVDIIEQNQGTIGSDRQEDTE